MRGVLYTYQDHGVMMDSSRFPLRSSCQAPWPENLEWGI